jgi:hypothetical protein
MSVLGETAVMQRTSPQGPLLTDDVEKALVIFGDQ